MVFNAARDGKLRRLKVSPIHFLAIFTLKSSCDVQVFVGVCQFVGPQRCVSSWIDFALFVVAFVLGSSFFFLILTAVSAVSASGGVLFEFSHS